MVPQRARAAGVKAATNGGVRGETNQFVERRARALSRTRNLHCERSEALQSLAYELWIALSLRSSQ
jgi:hypothetical protein